MLVRRMGVHGAVRLRCGGELSDIRLRIGSSLGQLGCRRHLHRLESVVVHTGAASWSWAPQALLHHGLRVGGEDNNLEGSNSISSFRETAWDMYKPVGTGTKRTTASWSVRRLDWKVP